MGLASVAPTPPALLGSVALAGVGGSTYHPAGMGFVSDVEPDDTAGRAMGIHELAGVVGNVLAPAFTGGLAAATDWRLALGVTAGVGLAAAAAFGVLSESDRPTGRSSSEAACGCADDSAPEEGGERTGARSGERERERGRGRGRLRRLRRLCRLRDDLGRLVGLPLAWWVLGLFLTKLLFTLQSYGVRTYLTSYVVERLGSSTGTANATFVVFLAGTALATVWFGSLADRFDRRRLLAGTFLLGGAFVAATALVPANAATFLAWFFVTGVAAYASLPVVNTLVAEYSEREFSGSLFGVVQTASALGGTVGPLLFGAVASWVGIRTTFPLIAVVGFVGALGFAAASRERVVARLS
jgi:MFS family permease